MPGSLYLGQQPILHDDKLTYKAIRTLDPAVLELAQMARARHLPYQTRAPVLIAGSALALAWVVIITAARLWVRKYRTRAFGADDYMIIPAALGCAAYLSLDIAQARAGCLGKHIYHCTYQEFQWFYELARCCFPIFYFTVFCVKISITLANRRITGMTSKNWQIAHWIYLALLGCLTPACVFFNIFPCSPIAAYFSLQSIAQVADPRTIKCLDQEAIGLATRYVHIITDWLLLPVPLIVIFKLQMPLGKKIRLMLVFCVGFISSLASIIRNVLTVRLESRPDITYDYYAVYAWNVVDIFFATIVASLPSLNGVIEQVIRKVKATGLRSGKDLLSKFGFAASYKRSTSQKDTEGRFRQLVDIELQSPPSRL